MHLMTKCWQLQLLSPKRCEKEKDKSGSSRTYIFTWNNIFVGFKKVVTEYFSLPLFLSRHIPGYEALEWYKKLRRHHQSSTLRLMLDVTYEYHIFIIIRCFILWSCNRIKRKRKHNFKRYNKSEEKESKSSIILMYIQKQEWD